MLTIARKIIKSGEYKAGIMCDGEKFVGYVTRRPLNPKTGKPWQAWRFVYKTKPVAQLSARVKCLKEWQKIVYGK